MGIYLNKETEKYGRGRAGICNFLVVNELMEQRMSRPR